jgi:hypothetical protein
LTSVSPIAPLGHPYDMRGFLSLLVLCSAAVACGEPTAADVERESVRVQRQLLAESADPSTVWNLIDLDPLIEHLPGMGTLEVRVDGRRKRWRGFVLERVIVRDDLESEPECPLVRRGLFSGKGANGLIIVSADGPSAIRPIEMCHPSSETPGGGGPVHRGAAYAFVMTAGRQGVLGTSGMANFRVLGLLQSSCGFLDVRDDDDEPLDVRCEIFRYAVSAEATLGQGRWTSSPSTLPPGARELSIRDQELMGMRLTVRCNERSEAVSGCERTYFGSRR